MITVDFEKTLRDLENYHKEVKRKLEFMVVGFSYLVVETAISKTPLGDARVYDSWYLARNLETGLRAEEGFAQGSWQVSTTGDLKRQEYYGSSAGDQALGLVKPALGNYQLGQSVYIGNNAYYFVDLEKNYSPQTFGLGIVAPTTTQIMATYQVELKRLFEKG